MRIALSYAGAMVVAVLLAAALYNSEVATPLPDGPLVVCDGSLHIEPEGCGPLGAAVISQYLDLPQSDALDVHIQRLEIDRALWGYLDRCTAKAYSGPITVEQVFPCP